MSQPAILAGMFARNPKAALVAQTAGAVNMNGNITVNLGSTPTAGNMLLFIGIWGTNAATVTTPLPSGVTVVSSAPTSYGTAANFGCNLGTRVVQSGDGKAWIFPTSAWPSPYNEGGYGYNCALVIEITGGVSVYSWTSNTFTLSGSTYGTLDWGAVGYNTPAFYIISMIHYFSAGYGGVKTWTPSAFGSPTYSLMVNLPNEGVGGGTLTPTGICYGNSLASENGQINVNFENGSGGTDTYPNGLFVVSK
jgi:hypothetical protein